MRLFDSYEAAVEASAPGETVCGTYRGDDPVYFLMSVDADDASMRAASFEARHGRAMSSYEQFLLGAAVELHERGVSA